jgi:hypothetical protein
MTDPIAKKMPITGYDGEEIVDANGVTWVYNAQDDVWINSGVIAEPDIVTETEDGLVSSATYQKLDLVQQLIDQGYDFGHFKLRGDSATPYFYFFYSADDLLKFIPESTSRLRMEVDINMLYQKLVRNCCAGPKGPVGDQGRAGRDGLAAANEVFKIPVIEENNYIVRTGVNTPIDTPISLRIFDVGAYELVDIRLSINPGEITITIRDDRISIDEEKTSLLYDGDILSGNIYFETGIELADKYKARQVGKKGIDGNDGSPFLQVVEVPFGDDSIRSQDAVISMRKGSPNDIVYYKDAINEKMCAHNIAILGGDLPIGGILDAKFAAVVMSPVSCKDICYFQLELCSTATSGVTSESQANCDVEPDIKVKDLELPDWTPVKSCVDRARCDQLQFDWNKITDPDYVWKILDDPCPPEQCCQQDFFWCPNVGDEPCGIEGEVKPPKRFLKPNCPCPCEKETEDDLLVDGVTFPTLYSDRKMGYNFPNETFPYHPEEDHNDDDEWVRECNVTNIRGS